MNITQLRMKHSRFTYANMSIKKDDTVLTVLYSYVLDPDIRFTSTFTFPRPVYRFSVDEVYRCLIRIGMVEAISYWKAACPSEFVIEAGMVEADELGFWQDLFIHGLGEFYYRNDIDFTMPGFVSIRQGDARAHKEAYDILKKVADSCRPTPIEPASDLIMMSGGKDTAVTLGMFSAGNRSYRAVSVNPTAAVQRMADTANIADMLVVTRVLDRSLVALNNEGYANGHTPFSALLAFIGVTMAALHGGSNVLVSNEKSANEGNTVYRGLEVNHQYSKSFRFEQLFRAYAAAYLFPGAVTMREEKMLTTPQYASVLRPFNDVQIAQLFSSYPLYFQAFRSCNVNSRKDTWCASCPKCAFTYLVMAAFVPFEDRMRMFGDEWFVRKEILTQIRGLVGLVPVKPFECVGTRAEATLALYMAVDAYAREGREIPEGLLRIKSDIGLSEAARAELHVAELESWGDMYNVPDSYIPLLRDAWSRSVQQTT